MFSRISYYVRQYGSPLVAIAILVLLAGDMVATARTKATLEELLAMGLVETVPQKAYTVWNDSRDLNHRIETPRLRGESDSALATRHVATVEAFHAAINPPKED